MGRHRNDPQGLARIALIGLAVALVMALVVVGGMALVSSFKSEPGEPGATTAATVGPERDQARGEDQPVYATIEVVGESVKLYAAEPDNTKIHWNGLYTQGDVRNVVWKELDLTISNSSAVRMTVKGKRFALPPKKNVSIRFIGGAPELVD